MSNRKGKGKIISRTELAEYFGVSGPTVDHWVRTGCPYVERGGKGMAWKFNTADVINWRIESRLAEGEQDEDEIDERKLRARQLKAKTLAAELELEKARGTVAPLDQVNRAIASAFAEVRANMRNIPARVTTTLIGETDEAKFKAVMLAEIDQALEALADTDLLNDEDPEIDDEDQEP